MSQLRVAVHGAGGRMGRSILSLLFEDESAGACCAFDSAASPSLGQDTGVLAGVGASGCVVGADLTTGLSDCDVAIDFSTPDALARLATVCREVGLPLVTGTTGLTEAAERAVERLAARVPVVVAPNMSVGVNVLFELAARATRLLGPDYDAEIVEMHHRHKVDAPSGTAVRLHEVVAAEKGLVASASGRHGREGRVGARGAGEIGVMALRGGDVVGDHTLVLAGPGERIELTHRAHSREVFARGAVRAAKWVVSQPPGRYGMADVLCST